uniref:Mitochondrial assembly of ribosomal large subunit 1 n=1 Tax=Chrysemys picta bellii TaxID=8478 RepID=A0A8C3IDP6_CHRPI
MFKVSVSSCDGPSLALTDQTCSEKTAASAGRARGRVGAPGSGETGSARARHTLDVAAEAGCSAACGWPGGGASGFLQVKGGNPSRCPSQWGRPHPISLPPSSRLSLRLRHSSGRKAARGHSVSEAVLTTANQGGDRHEGRAVGGLRTLARPEFRSVSRRHVAGQPLAAGAGAAGGEGAAAAPYRAGPGGRCALRSLLGRAGGAGPRRRAQRGAAGGRRSRAGAQGPRYVLFFVSDHALSKFNIDLIISLLRQENASNICVIQVPPEMRYSDYFIIVSGSSSRHLYAMAHYMLKMYKQLKQENDPHIQIEGKDTDDWMYVTALASNLKFNLCVCLFLSCTGSTVIHLMLPETREIYELEKLWTLRSYDDQLAQMVPESLPEDFIFGLPHQEQ